MDGIGPWLNQLYDADDDRKRVAANELVRMAHAEGLVVHPYTFRSDALPEGFASFEALVEFFVREVPVDGLFTDFPGKVFSILRRILR